MRCIVNFFFLFFCCRVVVTTPLLENGINQKLDNLQKFHVNNSRFQNPVRNPFLKFDKSRYQPEFHNYQNPPKFNHPNYFNDRSRHLPLSPLIPRNHQTPFVIPSRYNALDSYNTGPLIRPMGLLRTDKQNNVLENVKPVYPNRKMNFGEKLTHRLLDTARNVKKIISQPMIRNHYTSNQKKYMLIHPNGTVEDVDNLELVVAEHPNYVLVNGADIIPTNNESPVKLSEQEPHTLSHRKSTSELQLTQVAHQKENPTFKIQVNNEEPVRNIFENDDGSPIIFPTTEANNNTLIRNTPTTIIEIYPQFITSSNNSVTKIQPEGDKNLITPADISKDIIIANLADNDEIPIVNVNTREENYGQKNKFMDQVTTTEDDSGNILNRSTIPTNDINITSLYSEKEHLLDEIHLRLETHNESSIHDMLNERYNNNTSKKFREEIDTYIEKDSVRFTVNSTEIFKDDILPILPIENLTEIVKDYDLLTDQRIDESKSITSVPWSDYLSNTNDYHEIKSSEINLISATSILRDITDATDNDNPTSTEKRNVYFKIDRDFWDKLKNNEIPFDMVYFFQVEEPVVEKGIKTVAYPNGTVVTYETVQDGKEDNHPIIVKNIDVINPEVLN